LLSLSRIFLPHLAQFNGYLDLLFVGVYRRVLVFAIYVFTRIQCAVGVCFSICSCVPFAMHYFYWRGLGLFVFGVCVVFVVAFGCDL